MSGRSSLRTSLSDKKVAKAIARLAAARTRYLRRYPGESGARQAVHTVYGGAHLFTAETPRKLGNVALKSLDAHAPSPGAFAEAIGLPPHLADKVHARVIEKLNR